MGVVDPYTTVAEESFVARFLLDHSVETAETIANVDAFVEIPGGATWSLTIFTVDEVRRLLTIWKDSGEAGHGSYFWAVDQVIVPEAGLVAMTAAIRELVRSGEIERVGLRRETLE